MKITINEATVDLVDASLSGEVDADNCTQVGAALLDPAPVGVTMTLDVSKLAFLDSSGISELLRVNDAVESSGGTFTLLDPTDNVRRVLEITGLLDTFGLS